MMNTILSIQPRVAAAEGGKSPDEIIMELTETYLGMIPEVMN